MDTSSLAPGVASRQPLSARICDAVCLVFALWTLCCQVVVFLGGTLVWLLGFFAAVGVVVLVLGRRLREALPVAESPSSTQPAGASVSRAVRLGVETA